MITRKLSGGGNRTDRGAHVQEVLVSVIRTCAQQGRDALALLVSAFYATSPLKRSSPTLPSRRARPRCV